MGGAFLHAVFSSSVTGGHLLGPSGNVALSALSKRAVLHHHHLVNGIPGNRAESKVWIHCRVNVRVGRSNLLDAREQGGTEALNLAGEEEVFEEKEEHRKGVQSSKNGQPWVLEPHITAILNS